MGDQLIISISREFVAGGDHVAKKLAEEYGISLYDSNILEQMSNELDFDPKHYEEYDEKPRNYLLSKRVGRYVSSAEEITARAQFKYLRERADAGESFVVVGRVSDYVLRYKDCLVTIFITGKEDKKIDFLMKEHHISAKKARDMMVKMDRRRRTYHNSYADTKWGDSRYYDMCIDVTNVGIDAAAGIIKQYVDGIIAAKKSN